MESAAEVTTIRHPADAAGVLMPHFSHLDREIFKVILLNSRHKVIDVETVSIGTLDATLVHPREVFKPAVRRSAAAIIVAHNHPGGSIEPSSEDIALTRRLMSAGKLIGIEVLDHIIIAQERWASLKELGYE